MEIDVLSQEKSVIFDVFETIQETADTERGIGMQEAAYQ